MSSVCHDTDTDVDMNMLFGYSVAPGSRIRAVPGCFISYFPLSTVFDQRFMTYRITCIKYGVQGGQHHFRFTTRDRSQNVIESGKGNSDEPIDTFVCMEERMRIGRVLARKLSLDRWKKGIGNPKSK